MTNDEHIAESRFTVRDYECDLQGVVNNANYLHYLEHSRHEYLMTKDIDFAQLHSEGIDLLVSKIVIEYKHPLKSGDKFVVRTKMQRLGNIRINFFQDIYKIPDETLIVKSVITSVATKNGRPFYPEDIIKKFDI